MSNNKEVLQTMEREVRVAGTHLNYIEDDSARRNLRARKANVEDELAKLSKKKGLGVLSTIPFVRDKLQSQVEAAVDNARLLIENIESASDEERRRRGVNSQRSESTPNLLRSLQAPRTHQSATRSKAAHFHDDHSSTRTRSSESARFAVFDSPVDQYHSTRSGVFPTPTPYVYSGPYGHGNRSSTFPAAGSAPHQSTGSIEYHSGGNPLSASPMSRHGPETQSHASNAGGGQYSNVGQPHQSSSYRASGSATMPPQPAYVGYGSAHPGQVYSGYSTQTQGAGYYQQGSHRGVLQAHQQQYAPGMTNYQSPPQYQHFQPTQGAPGTSSGHYQQGSVSQQYPYTSGRSAIRHRKTNTFGHGDLPTHQTIPRQSTNDVDEEDEGEDET